MSDMAGDALNYSSASRHRVFLPCKVVASCQSIRAGYAPTLPSEQALEARADSLLSMQTEITMTRLIMRLLGDMGDASGCQPGMPAWPSDKG